MTGENQAPATNATASPMAATQGPGLKDNATSLGASGTGASVGRLIGERAFHFAASAASFAPQVDLSAGSAAADLAQAEATPAKADAVPSSDNAAAPIANLAAAAATNRASSSRAGPHEATRSARKAEVSAPQPATREANSAAAVAPPESSGSGKAPDDRPRDAGGFTPPSASQTSPFGALLSASLAAGPSFAAYASTAGVAAPNGAPGATAVAPSAPPAAPPVKEIDVDLSAGGLEDVSMTMRLAGDKLSVVIRAASSETLSSIEGARDAIADRLAAIGQPLELAHCQADGPQRRWEHQRKRGFRRRQLAASGRRAGRFERCGLISPRRWSRSQLLAAPAPRAPRGRSPASAKWPAPRRCMACRSTSSIRSA